MSYAHSRAQRGSVLIYILIAVALFAALAMAVSNMMRGGGGNIGAEKAGVNAGEILEYGRALREGVQALKISNGCEEGQISFERSPFDGTDSLYVNSAAPTDFSCHVFHVSGGGLGYQEGFDGKAWRFTSAFAVADVGSPAPELVGAIEVNRAFCDLINARVGVSDAAIQAGTSVVDGSAAGGVLPVHQGVFTGSALISAAPYAGKMTACYRSSTAGPEQYTVYQVLMAR